MRIIPNVVEEGERGERGWDLFSRLMKERIIFIGDQIDEVVASLIIAEMLFLDRKEEDRDIELYINSPGGSVVDGLAIYDTMQMIRCDVATFCVGMAASMGALLLAGGAKGKRYGLPNSRIMIHQVIGGFHGSAPDTEVHFREMMYHKKNLNEILSKHTGQPLEKIERDTERDFFMSPDEAKEYGLIDHIVQRKNQ